MATIEVSVKQTLFTQKRIVIAAIILTGAFSVYLVITYSVVWETTTLPRTTECFSLVFRECNCHNKRSNWSTSSPDWLTRICELVQLFPKYGAFQLVLFNYKFRHKRKIITCSTYAFVYRGPLHTLLFEHQRWQIFYYVYHHCCKEYVQRILKFCN